MSPQMIEAIRKEAFVQGFLRAHARSCGLKLSDFTDEQVLSMLPNADEFYRAYRAERTPKPCHDCGAKPGEKHDPLCVEDSSP